MTRNTLNRRTFLRGTGVAIALPFLDAMAPASAPAAPLRMAFVYVPNGIIMKDWWPAMAESGPLPVELPKITAPLARFREDIQILGGLTCNGGRALGDGPGDHGRAGASYLTSTHPKKTVRDIHTGVSVDQIAARQIGAETRFASLELGCEDGVMGGNCDNGYSCAYSNSLSWRTESAPMPPEVRPRALFDRLFGGDFIADPAARAKAQRYRASVLDVVLSDAQQLKNNLGRADQAKLEEYLYAVRDVEQRIQKTEKEFASRGEIPMTAPAPSVPDTMTEHSRLMFDILTMAFQTNATRVATLALALEQSTRPYREAGVSEGHHGLTHHMGDADKIAKVSTINRFHMECFTYFLDRLKSTREGEGTLLDHSMIVYGSGISDGNEHHHHNLPVILAGGGNGTLTPGRFVKYPAETPMANLYVAMLSRMGAQVERMGDSTGQLSGL